MKKIVTTALFLALLVAGVTGIALAQGHMGHMEMKHRMPGPDGDAGFFSHISDMLALNQEQQDAAKQIHQAAFEKAGPLMEQHQAQMDEIETLLDSGKATAQEIGTKVIAAHATRTQLKAIHEDAMTQFKALLTDEQKAKLETMEELHSDMKGRMHHSFYPAPPLPGPLPRAGGEGAPTLLLPKVGVSLPLSLGGGRGGGRGGRGVRVC